MDGSEFLNANLVALMLVVATPMLLAALGELLTERAGVLNVSIEGTMAVGASAGFLGAYVSGSNLVGILTAMAAAGFMGLVLAVCCVTLRMSQLTVGLSLFVFGLGLASLLYRVVIGLQTVTPQIETFAGLDDASVQGARWLLGLPAPFYLVMLLLVALHLFLFYTPQGMRLRAVGENPRAAEAQGVKVFAVRYAAVIIGATWIGAAGALLPMLLTGTYTDMMVGGRGWIAMMLVILGRWVPFGVLLGGLLFGYVEALKFSLLLTVKTIAPQFLQMMPYLFVVIVAIRAYRGAQAPQALMRPYDREART